jgi:hypothetical protein
MRNISTHNLFFQHTSTKGRSVPILDIMKLKSLLLKDKGIITHGTRKSQPKGLGFRPKRIALKTE